MASQQEAGKEVATDKVDPGDDGSGGASAFPSEEDMLRYLSDKYLFVPKLAPHTPPTTVSKPSISDTGAKPKVPPLMSLATQPVPSHFPFTPVPQGVKVPKIPSFSGDQPTPKSEISFYEWRHEVRCLQKDTSLSSSHVLQAMRPSLKGTARRLLVSLGESISVDSVLRKLELNFSEPTSKGVNMKEFFNSSQRADEPVTSFGCRLESLLDQAFESSRLPITSRAEMLCERLWSGLRSEALRTNTRHKLDSATDYDSFLRDVRKVEKELSLSNPKLKCSSQQQNAQQSSEQHAIQRTPDFQKQLSDLEQRLNSRINSVQSGVDKKFNTILYHLESLSTSSIPQQSVSAPPQLPQPLPDTTQPPPLLPRAPPRGNNGYRRGKGGNRGNYRGQQNSQQAEGHPNY